MAENVCIIGLDGATWDVLDPMMDIGILPNLRRIVDGGVRSKLITTYPPLTAPAWSSLQTGKNPGKHGIFDFYLSRSGEYINHPSNAASIKSKTLWRILSDHDRRVGVLNVPMTYPPEQVNGVLVAGMMTPGTEVVFTYPENFYEELKGKIGDYYINPIQFSGDERGRAQFLAGLEDGAEGFFSNLTRVAAQRKQAALYIIDEYRPDFFMCVFVGTDRTQHYFWEFVQFDEEREKRNQLVRENVIDYYREIDKSIGEIVGRYGDDLYLFIVSDHGFGPYDGQIYLNKWFLDMGLLVSRKITGGVLQKLKKSARRLGLNRVKLAKTLKIQGIARTSPFFSSIDWSRTKAYLKSCNGIYINLKGRDAKGIVNPGQEYEDLLEFITGELFSLADPETGKKVVEEVYRKEQVYSGPLLDDAPDLIIRFSGEYAAQHTEYKTSSIKGPSWLTGCHRMDGVLVMSGPGIKTGERLPDASIMDVAPTVLYTMGLPVPDDMDGVVFQDAFEDSFKEARPIRYTAAESGETRNGQDYQYTPDDEDEIHKRLKGLGYVD